MAWVHDMRVCVGGRAGEVAKGVSVALRCACGAPHG